MSILKTSFTRNLRGYLSTARITSAFSTGKAKRTTQSLSSDPVEPIDAVFSTFPEQSQKTETVPGFEPITQHLLASAVVENLLHIHNEISALNEETSHREGPNAKAARAYRDSQENVLQPMATIYSFGDAPILDSEVTPR